MAVDDLDNDEIEEGNDRATRVRATPVPRRRETFGARAENSKRGRGTKVGPKAPPDCSARTYCV